MGDFTRVQVNSQNIADVKAAAASQASSGGPAPMGATARETGKSVRIVMKGDSAQTFESGVNRSSANADVALPQGVNPGERIVARSAFGRPQSGSEISDKSVVKIGDMETTVAAARAAGLIAERNGEFYYSGDSKPGFKSASAQPETAQRQPDADQNNDTSKADQDKPAETPETSEADKIAPFAQDAGEALHHVVTNLREGEVQSLSKELITNGKLTPEAASLAAQRLGWTPAQVAEKAEGIRQAFFTQASAAVGAHAEALFDYARTHAPQELRRAVEAHVNSGDISGYRSLSQRYIETMDQHSPDVLLESNEGKQYAMRREPNGAITLDFGPQVGRVAWNVAVRQGFIKPFFRAPPVRR